MCAWSALVGTFALAHVDAGLVWAAFFFGRLLPLLTFALPFRPSCSGNRKFRALRLETGNFSWPSEGVTRKTRLIDGAFPQALFSVWSTPRKEGPRLMLTPLSYFAPFAVVYNASNNELERTKTLVKSAIIVIDATPFKQWCVCACGNVKVT